MWQSKSRWGTQCHVAHTPRGQRQQKWGYPNINMKHNCPAALMRCYVRPFFITFQSSSRLYFPVWHLAFEWYRYVFFIMMTNVFDPSVKIPHVQHNNILITFPKIKNSVPNFDRKAIRCTVHNLR